MNLLLWWWWRILVGPPVQPLMHQLPDPATVPREEWGEVVTARSLCGLKPWPNLPDGDYFNRVIGTCSVCGVKIYGGQGISCGWKKNGKPDTRCENHFDKK